MQSKQALQMKWANSNKHEETKEKLRINPKQIKRLSQ